MSVNRVVMHALLMQHLPFQILSIYKNVVHIAHKPQPGFSGGKAFALGWEVLNSILDMVIHVPWP